jgi:DNA primase
MDLFMETALAAAGSAVEEKARAAETVLERLTALTSDLEQDLYLKELARRSGIDPQLLKNKLAAAVQRSSRARQRPSRPPPAGADEYPLPGGGEEPPATPVSPRQRARPLPPWSKTEQILLCLLMFNPAIRAKISSDGVENFFPSSLALQTAELLLTTWKGSEGDGEETFIARLDPHEAPFLKVLMAVDSQAYAGDQGAMLEDCRKSLLREKQKLQREELLDQIRRAEQSGDREQAKELMDKFTKLK